jgi:hypothetical protein
MAVHEHDAGFRKVQELLDLAVVEHTRCVRDGVMVHGVAASNDVGFGADSS